MPRAAASRSMRSKRRELRRRNAGSPLMEPRLATTKRRRRTTSFGARNRPAPQRRRTLEVKPRNRGTPALWSGPVASAPGSVLFRFVLRPSAQNVEGAPNPRPRRNGALDGSRGTGRRCALSPAARKRRPSGAIPSLPLRAPFCFVLRPSTRDAVACANELGAMLLGTEQPAQQQPPLHQLRLKGLNLRMLRLQPAQPGPCGLFRMGVGRTALLAEAKGSIPRPFAWKDFGGADGI
jgi:hypothetical protein